jgi:pimeloyl-ACP methyl ester carboxylesterase
VSFAATDGVKLTGLLYEPKKATTRAAVWLHGTGGSSIFTSSRTNLLAEELVSRGIAWLPFNNRGSDFIRRMRKTSGTKSKTFFGGSTHELIRECVFDIDGAARFLRERGYRELYLLGHSTGANKVAVYDSYVRRNPYARYVLLAGGDDVGLTYEKLGARRFRNALEKARAMIKARRGDELVPRTLFDLPLSWRAFLDMHNPDGDYNVFPFGEVLRGERLSRKPLFRHVQSLGKPSLFVYGDRDEFLGRVTESVAVLADAIGPGGEIAVLADADHSFTGREAELGGLVAEWLLA